VFIQAQHPSQIESQIRVLAQDFWHCRNRSYLRLSFFRQPKDIKVAIYENPPDKGAKQEPMDTKTIKIDAKGLGQCYDTTAGAGLSGRLQGDTVRTNKGLPWWSIWAFGVGFVFLVWFLIKVVMAGLMDKGIQSVFGVHKPARAAVASSVPPADTKGDFTHSLANRFVPTLHNSGVPTQMQAQSEVRPAVQMTGYAVIGGRVRVLLSDGRVLSGGDRRLGAFTPEYCVVDGETNWLSVGPITGVAAVPWYGGGSVSYPSASYPLRNQPVFRGPHRVP
jgi:hypothetical protein